MSKHVGIGKEAVYNTKVAPEIWLECLGENIRTVAQYQELESIRAAQTRGLSLGSMEVLGPARFAANYQELAHLAYYLIGDVSGSAPTYTTPLNTSASVFNRPSLTIEVQRDPDDGGETWKYTGCVITSFGFQVAVDEVAEVAIEVYGSSEVREAGNTPSYGDFDLVVPTDCSVLIDALAVDVERFQLAIDWPVDKPKKMGSTALARKPKDAGAMKISGSFTLLQHNATQYAKFIGATTVDLELRAALSGAPPEAFSIHLNKCKLQSATPALEGRAYPKPVYEFVAHYDSSGAVWSAVQFVTTNDELAIP